ncbi:restriction endonuclease subunit S [Staphylococcus hominis]|uniref:restriction endonuclease subunit S n=1 Tax=Staphylococcus hominis TaxID=1290 RepID=UPI0011A72AAD|nr:restriction endonuclease subunit S [Staphylococcus hominis]
MTEQTNTPKLRFPEFKNEWSYDLLGDVVTNKSKKFDPKKEEATKDIELDSIEQNTGRLLDTYISNDFTSQKNKFKKDNVLYSKLRPYLNKYYYATIDGVCSSEIWVLNTLNKDVLVNKFLYYFIQTNRFSSVTNKSAGSKMPRADWELVKNIRLYKGSIKEQEKIGYFFSKLDQQIELEEKKLELLEQQKRGYMQKIFSQELRFKDENGNKYPNWQTVKIGSILKERKERSGDGEMLSVTINHGIVKFDEIDRKDNSSKDKSNYKKVYKNDIAYNSMRMWQGASGKAEFDGIVSPAYTVVTPIENINSNFIAYYFKTHNMIHKFRINSQGLTSDTWNLKYKQLKDIKISICSKEEQDKIADLLTILDTRIKKQNHKLEILNINKKGLLQKMFV